MGTDLTGNYPLILDGGEAGTLTVSRDGLYWVFDARSAPRAELVRLSVFGEDGEGYLGVMEPCGEKLVLTKRLSRNALAGFPTAITHAGERGTREAGVEASSPLAAADGGNSGDDAPPDEAKPPSRALSVPPGLRWLPCPNPCSLFSSLPEKCAFGGVHGALFASDGERTCLAVPAGEAPPLEPPAFFCEANFSGKPYRVCVLEDGRLLRSSV